MWFFFLKMKTPIDYFSGITNPQIERGKEHLLRDIVFITIAAVMYGAETWNDIEDYGESRKQCLQQYLKLPNGIPSHYTFNRAYSILNPTELENCFLVHAGFDVGYEPLNEEDLFTNAYAMLWIRKFKGDLEKTNQKPVVHGHVVHNLEEIKENLELAKENRTAIVPIDNGCVYVSLGKYEKYKGEVGNLCAIEITENENTWELFYTPFRDK